jgi:hypothetical protein
MAEESTRIPLASHADPESAKWPLPESIEASRSTPPLKKNTAGKFLTPLPEEGEEEGMEKSETHPEEEYEKEEDDAAGQGGYEKDSWRPCELKAADLQNLQDEGFLKAGSWRIVEKEERPNLQDGERVMIKAHVERGISLPPSEFFV